jgi:hypothetical protein
VCEFGIPRLLLKETKNMTPMKAIAAALTGLCLLACVGINPIQPASASSPSVVNYQTGANQPAIQAAIQALRVSEKGQNIPISDIKAALVDLSNDGQPELFVDPGVLYCGSMGCTTFLYELGMDGWIEIGTWQPNVIAITRTLDPDGWLDLLINGHLWRKGMEGYEKVR